ncbi:MAG: pyridoxine 5'-phosphate synthase, partial [Bacteroidota bacterium]|nr:pyridoxine 5'-phosphate synthase [Bacteroidota bacterium]
MKLSINIDHVATIRNARGGLEPDPIEAARIAEDAGADGIVCHLREDRRHIRDIDVEKLRRTITTKLDLEMAATKEIIAIAKKIKPDLATFVPEKRQELTTEGGLDVLQLKSSLKRSVGQLQENGIPVSLFINPIRKQVEAAKEIGAKMIEINTGEYTNARSSQHQQKLLSIIQSIAVYGKDLGLIVNAGH